MKTLILGLVLMTGTVFAGVPYGTYSRNGRISIRESGEGFWRVENQGSADWALTAFGTETKVSPGDRFRLRGAVRNQQGAPDGVRISVVLNDGRGQALEWGYAGKRLVPDGTEQETVFAIPQGVARIVARVGGRGDAAFEVSRLTLERIGRVELPADVPERFELRSDALEVAVGSDGGSLAVTDRRTGRRWTTVPSGKPRHYFVRKFDSDGRRLRLGLTDAVSLRQLAVVYELDREAPSEFTVTVAGRGEMTDALSYPEPFAGKAGDMMVLPLSEGFRLPMREVTFPVWNPAMWSSSMSMAFFGVEEDATGAGWMAIAETRNDAQVYVANDHGAPVAIGPLWKPERGQYGYPRVVRFVFFDKGGYVAMARRYRRTAEAQGLVKTFREKAKERPLVDRLLGAPNVWYFGGGRTAPSSADMARELKDAGIDRFLWSSDGPAESIVRIAAMPDVLVGRYDCYRDVYTPQLLQEMGSRPNPANEICRNTSAWPDDVIWNRADDSNSVRKAWGVTCRDGVKRFCAAQCTLCQAARERRNVAWELKSKPFTARFIDVTMAVGAEECENPAHPMTRTICRKAACDLLGLLGDEFKLVVGSEQGIDFAVPVCDYFEGMMSPGPTRMPHGRPGAQRPDIFREGLNPTNVTPKELSRVVDFGLGEKYRVPLFELVFHDCCCAHWYWYDYSNRPICLWPKRDLFNVLYGTAPMYIFDYRLWTERKEMFVKSYRTVCPVARRTGYSEMTDHRALTADRSVQRSVFSDGTTVTVNFGVRPFRLEDGSELAPMSHHVGTRVR